jgi:hypothetical protein
MSTETTIHYSNSTKEITVGIQKTLRKLVHESVRPRKKEKKTRDATALPVASELGRKWLDAQCQRNKKRATVRSTVTAIGAQGGCT